MKHDPGSCNEIQEMDDNDPAKNDRKESKVIAGHSKGKAFWDGVLSGVVVEELILEMSAGEHSNIGVVMFSAGFTLMMALDVALG